MSVMFFRSVKEQLNTPKKSWSNQDIADFYRAVDILKQAGLNTEVDSGVTDEDDPWFVFVRPDSGDVIAHFARIDSQFIAVSALNKEVYKGKDIRTIVDQMLDKHPMLLPQTKSGAGRLFLHPSVALTAFLAAAFILSIDGVKATNLGEIITSAASGNINYPNKDGSSSDGVTRTEALKGMLSDVSHANYNVAILGAALIAHEFSLNEVSKITEPDISNRGSISETDVSMIDDENELVDAGIAVDRRNSEGSSGVTSQSSVLTQAANYEGSESGESLNENSNHAKYEQFVEQSVLMDVPVDKAVDWENGYKINGNNKSLLKTNYLSKSNKTNIEAAGDYEISVQLETPISDGVSSLPVIDFLENFEVIFQAEVSDFNSGRDLFLVSVETFSFESDLVLFSDMVSSTLEQPAIIASSVKFDSVGGGDGIQIEGQVTKPLDMPSGDFSPKSPIVGHSFSNPDRVLQLTDGIDVVFYSGGEAEIAGFELGTDLLWFFLSPQDVMQGSNHVNSFGDLVLDFGETGRLTFLGVVSDALLDTVA